MHLCITCTHQYRNKDKVEQHKQGQQLFIKFQFFPALSFLISDFTFRQAKPSQGNETSSQ